MKIVFIKQNSHWLSQQVNTCGGSRSSVTYNLIIECFTAIINEWKLIFKSRSRNPSPLFTLIEVLVLKKKCCTFPGSACEVLVHHSTSLINTNAEDQTTCGAGGSGREELKQYPLPFPADTKTRQKKINLISRKKYTW